MMTEIFPANPIWRLMMACTLQIALVMVLGVGVLPALAAEPPRDAKGKEKAKIEFRWLTDKPVKGVTEAEGFQTTCGPELSYAYLKPVLTAADVTVAEMKKLDLTANNLGIQYMVDFQVSKAALKKLSDEAGDRASRELAVFVDDKYWGTHYFKKAEPGKFAPTAGMIPSKETAERIVASCK